MPRTTTLVAALLPALTAAHFSILHPPAAFISTGSEPNQPPCGPGTLPDSQAPAHPYLTSGSQIALSTHGEADWAIQYSLDAVPAAAGAGGNWSDMLAPLETEGDGTFCITTARAQALVDEAVGPISNDRSVGKKGWISIRAEMQEGTFYKCAYVNFVNVTTLEFPLACKNDTSVRVGYDIGDDDDKTSTTTTSSTRYTNSTTTETTTGITSTSAGTTTLTGTNTSPTVSMPSPTDGDDGDDGDSSTATNQPTDVMPTDTPPQPTNAPVPTDGEGGDENDGPSTITSTSIVVPTQTGGAGGGGGQGTATSSGAIQVPTGAAVNTKGSPLGMAGFSAVVLGAGILCAGLLA